MTAERKNRWIKLATAACALVIGFGAAGLTAEAAPVIAPYATSLNSGNFDYERYAAENPDVVAALGTSESALFSHYNNNGVIEGRKAYLDVTSMLTVDMFDATYYAQMNPDVVAALGTDANALFAHYINNGFAEGREAAFTSRSAQALVKATKIAAQITTPEMTDVEKMQAVHDWIICNCYYDIEDIYGDESNHYVGMLLNGSARCEGYTEAFDVFMRILGIEDWAVCGFANGGFHAWNQVRVDGGYLNVDSTWDDPLPDRPGIVFRYDYFLISDADMSDHQKVTHMNVAWFE
ncbi:MAG: hypothetical protein K6G23_00705 [Lachnospiraceae bacterium]|nr:hypothetical protein [Lachnospiraceae bacterium]